MCAALFFRLRGPIALLLVVAALSGCSRERVPHEAADASPSEELHCSFKTGAVPGRFCRVSIYALIVETDRYVGRRVLTTAYLDKGPGPSMGLAPSAAAFEANDLIGCIQIEGPLKYAENGQPLSDGLYAVTMTGTLRESRGNLCAARLEDPVIVEARAIDSQR